MAKTGKKNSVIEKTEKALKTWSNQAATALENVRSDYMEDLQTFNNVHESATNMMNDVGEKFYKLSKVAEQVKEHDPTEGANVKVTEEKDKWRVNPYLKKHPLSIMKVFRKGTDAQAWPPIQKETIEVEIDKTTQE